MALLGISAPGNNVLTIPQAAGSSLDACRQYLLQLFVPWGWTSPKGVGLDQVTEQLSSSNSFRSQPAWPTFEPVTKR